MSGNSGRKTWRVPKGQGLNGILGVRAGSSGSGPLLTAAVRKTTKGRMKEEDAKEVTQRANECPAAPRLQEGGPETIGDENTFPKGIKKGRGGDGCLKGIRVLRGQHPRFKEK